MVSVYVKSGLFLKFNYSLHWCGITISAYLQFINLITTCRKTIYTSMCLQTLPTEDIFSGHIFFLVAEQFLTSFKKVKNVSLLMQKYLEMTWVLVKFEQLIVLQFPQPISLAIIIVRAYVHGVHVNTGRLQIVAYNGISFMIYKPTPFYS